MFAAADSNSNSSCCSSSSSSSSPSGEKSHLGRPPRARVGWKRHGGCPGWERSRGAGSGRVAREASLRREREARRGGSESGRRPAFCGRVWRGRCRSAESCAVSINEPAQGIDLESPPPEDSQRGPGRGTGSRAGHGQNPAPYPPPRGFATPYPPPTRGVGGGGLSQRRILVASSLWSKTCEAPTCFQVSNQTDAEQTASHPIASPAPNPVARDRRAQRFWPRIAPRKGVCLV